MKIIGNIIYGLVVIILLAVAGLTVVSGINIPGNYKMMAVQSGSMEPTIKTGSIVVVKPEKDYKVGDIITFKDLNKSKTTVTHRIASVSGQFVTTKGDANKTADTDLINKSQIVGKEFLAIPYIGYIVGFSKTQTGFIILVIIPATLIIYTELMTIKNEAKRLIIERRSRKLTTTEEIEEKVGEEIIDIEKTLKKKR